MHSVRRASQLHTHTSHFPVETRNPFNLTIKLFVLSAVMLLALTGQQNAMAQSDVPGTPVSAQGGVAHDQKAGSVLIYPVYTSLASASNLQNSRISMTNVDTRGDVAVHLFFVDGSNCSVADSYVCLTANQTTTFLMSDLDPGITGYVVAVAVNSLGCPINFNWLIGDSYVKFGTGQAANLGAIAVGALPGLDEVPCSAGSSLATLRFDGLSYNPLPRTLAADSLPDRPSGNETLLVIDRIGGNLATTAATLGSVFGLLFNDEETPVSFSFTQNVCQFRALLSNNFPRTTPRYTTVIPTGHTGWMKLWTLDDGAIVGATLNFNPNVTRASGAFNQGHNLHALTVTTAASYTIPVFPPTC